MEFDSDSALSENLTNNVNTMDYSEALIRYLVPGWARTLMAVYIVTAILIGVPGNSLVLLILLKLRTKTSTDWFVIFIALCDVISLLFHGLLTLNVTVDLWKIVHTQFLCKFDFYVVHFTFMQSSLLITCMGVDRYVKTCKPHSVCFTSKSALICCFTILSVSAIFSISHFFTSKVNTDGHCITDSSKTATSLSLYIVRFMIFAVCSVALCVMYSKIAIRIRSRMKVGLIENKIHNNVQKTKMYRRCVGLFSSNQQLALEPVNISQTGDQKTDTKTSRVPGAYIATENRINTNTEHRIFYVSASKEGEVHQISRGLNERATTSNNSAEQINQTVQITATCIKQQERKITKQINKTTKTMGAITFVFIISSIIPTIAGALLPVSVELKKNPVLRVVIYFLLRLYFISFFANPLFYIWLSSNFRKRILEILNVCKK